MSHSTTNHENPPPPIPRQNHVDVLGVASFCPANPILRCRSTRVIMDGSVVYQLQLPSGGSIPLLIGNTAYDTAIKFAEAMSFPSRNDTIKKYMPISAALQKMKRDMEFLDEVASRSSQLTTVEVATLMGTVLVSAVSPALFSMKIVELLVPSMAALSAAIGISAEYVGKVAVANGKEVAALAIQATAESEGLLAQAERVKAVLPLCVGIATTSSAFALLAPTFAEEIAKQFAVPVANEFFLLFPLISVLSAAIAGLATQEANGLANRAIGVGKRRFASSNSVGRTWLSATEQVDVQSTRTTAKWVSFAVGVLPGPLIGAICPGALSFKAILVAAVAAAQAAYYLSSAEYYIAIAVDAVALKARSAAVADTYANQASRAGAILPFTSALAGLCAAASAAAIELLPLVNTLELQTGLALLFPSGAALLAAAASVSKARCEIDAAAASTVAAEGLSGNDPFSTSDGGNGADPITSVGKLVKIALSTTKYNLSMKAKKVRYIVTSGSLWRKLKKWFRSLITRREGPQSSNKASVDVSQGADTVSSKVGPVDSLSSVTSVSAIISSESSRLSGNGT